MSGRRVHNVMAWVYGVLLAALLALPSFAADDAPKVRPRLIAEPAALVPGKTTWVGVHFEIEPEWHIYWNGANDTGFEPRVKWSLPEGLKAGTTLWPAPTRHIAAEFILDHVYENRVTLLVPIEVAADFKAAGPVEIAADLNWLVCKESCIPEEARVSAKLPVGSTGPSPSAADAKLLEAARQRVPKSLKEGVRSGVDNVGVSSNGRPIGAGVVKIAGAKALRFYPHQTSSRVVNLLKGGEASGEVLELELEAEVTPDAAPGQAAYTVRLEGVVEVEWPDGRTTWFDTEKRMARSLGPNPASKPGAKPASK